VFNISIITPSFNSSPFLGITIDSVKLQKYPNLEYIVIDGGSTDCSVDIIKKNETHLAYWTSEPDNGQSHAINKGIQKVTGTIINWLNADDYYEPETLSKVAGAFEQKEAKVVMGKSRLFQGGKTIQYSRGTDVYLGNLSKTIGWARIDQPETFFRKEAWEKVGLLNEQLHYIMDREWWMRYLYEFGLEGIVKIDDILVNFRLHDQSKTVSAGSRFQIEHDTIFYILSTLLKNVDLDGFLRTNLRLDLNIDSEIRHWTEKHIVEGSFNYYLLKRSEELYYQGEHGLCRDLIRFIKPHLLVQEDIPLLNKIKMRSRVPRQLIQFFRR
jgi:glycosyltransferase involved in cell wall biosynthesis